MRDPDVPSGSILTSLADGAEILVQSLDLAVAKHHPCFCCAAVNPRIGGRPDPWIGCHSSDSDRREDQLSDEPSDEHQQGS